MIFPLCKYRLFLYTLVPLPGGLFALTPRVFLTLRFLITFLVLASIAGLVVLIGGLQPVQVWPFLLGAAGFAGLHAGIRKRKRYSADFAIPSAVFILLSVFFCLFSLGIIPMRLRDFVLRYWFAFPFAALLFLALSKIFTRRKPK